MRTSKSCPCYTAIKCLSPANQGQGGLLPCPFWDAWSKPPVPSVSLRLPQDTEAAGIREKKWGRRASKSSKVFGDVPSCWETLPRRQGGSGKGTTQAKVPSPQPMLQYIFRFHRESIISKVTLIIRILIQWSQGIKSKFRLRLCVRLCVHIVCPRSRRCQPTQSLEWGTFHRNGNVQGEKTSTGYLTWWLVWYAIWVHEGKQRITKILVWVTRWIVILLTKKEPMRGLCDVCRGQRLRTWFKICLL